MDRYLLALGSNMRHHRHGTPAKVLGAALTEMRRRGIAPIEVSRIVNSAAVGPSLRRYANAVVLVRTSFEPAQLLAELKAIERAFGRRRGGRRWGGRVLDLDIVLWEQGAWSSPGLTVPHSAFRERAFVLGPACEVAPGWRDPITGLTLAQLNARLTRRARLPIAHPRWGP